MRRPRLLAPPGIRFAIYHCVSRVVNRDKVFGEAEKNHFIKLMRLYAQLYGLRILTHCLMDNHFHILVEVPKPPDVLPTNEELVALVRATLGEERADNLANWFQRWTEQGNDLAIVAERERWFRQMWNLPSFMKVLKQRFSQWFNGTRPTRRAGTLWEDRYRSVLVENGQALRAIAAYVDLNPIRAGKTHDPKDYRWSGYGEALRGSTAAFEGLQWIFDQSFRNDVSMKGSAAAGASPVLDWYREQLYTRGEEVRNAEGSVIKQGFTEEEIQEVIQSGGRLPLTVLLRLRVRHFTDGAVLGTTEFVEKVFQSYRDRFSGRRKAGSKRIQKLDPANPLRVARGLVVRAVG